MVTFYEGDILTNQIIDQLDSFNNDYAIECLTIYKFKITLSVVTFFWWSKHRTRTQQSLALGLLCWLMLWDVTYETTHFRKEQSRTHVSVRESMMLYVKAIRYVILCPAMKSSSMSIKGLFGYDLFCWNWKFIAKITVVK